MYTSALKVHFAGFITSQKFAKWGFPNPQKPKAQSQLHELSITSSKVPFQS